MSAAQIEALQRLVANHNFGPDLTRPANAGLRDHWWPANFRSQLMPKLAALGLDADKYFARDEHGVQKFAQQDYDAGQSFSGAGLVSRMEQSAQWTRGEVLSVWASLARFAPAGFDLQTYAPYLAQRDGVGRLVELIASIERVNAGLPQGVAAYRSADGALHRVFDKDPKVAGSKARASRWDADSGEWRMENEGDSPVALFFALVNADLGAK